MIKGEKNEKLFKLGSVLVFTLLCILGLTVFFDAYYDLNDDTVMKDIISGTFTGTPSGYSIQMLYPLSWLLAVLYTAIPGVAWYGLFLCLCQFGALAVIAWRLLELSKNVKIQVGLLVIEVVIAVGLLLRNYVYMQYSVTSGICMATAIFWYITSRQEGDWKKYLKMNFPALILIWLSFGIRTELCIMLVPFLLVAGVIKWLGEEHIFVIETVKKYVFLILSALVGMCFLYAVDALSYSQKEWKEFRVFFDARTDVYDFYGIPDYDANQQFYQELGMSRQSYALLQNYNFSLDEQIDADAMAAIADYQKQQAKEGQGLYYLGGLAFKNSPKEAIWLYKQQLIHGTPYIILAAYILYFILGISRRKSGCYGKLLLVFGARSVVWLYLLMVDRTPERITTPLYLAEFLVLIGWLIEEFYMQQSVCCKEDKLLIQMKRFGSVLVLLLCGVVASMISIEHTWQEYSNRVTANARWENLIAYCEEHPENYYAVDVYSSTSYQGNIYSERVFGSNQNSYRNFDICGGWAAKSPLMHEKLLQSGVLELKEALLTKNQSVYFIAAYDKDMSWLPEYYLSCGYRVQVELADTIRSDEEVAFCVYRLEMVNE